MVNANMLIIIQSETLVGFGASFSGFSSEARYQSEQVYPIKTGCFNTD